MIAPGGADWSGVPEEEQWLPNDTPLTRSPICFMQLRFGYSDPVIEQTTDDNFARQFAGPDAFPRAEAGLRTILRLRSCRRSAFWRL